MKSIFQRRSSWPSSLVTGLIGWNAFVLIVVLVMGYHGSPFPVFGYASSVGVLQVVTMRLGFGLLRLERRVAHGAVWGALIGTALALALRSLLPFWQDKLAWLLATALYTGAPVGAFLSYFQRDDQQILEQTRGERRFGRDAHWLEPFAFGALIYASAFVLELVKLGFFVVPVGAMVGVFAAGASHFSPDRLKNHAAWFGVVGLVGAGFGVASGWLFRQFSLSFDPLVHGACAGAATFVITFLRGRSLARRFGTLGEGRP
ncbi:MAG TPA: hypothetical protein VHM70_08300 [Polyangiaceae bacterium]|nr:hypothetical protein [Polyangiaceae bacterium]